MVNSTYPYRFRRKYKGALPLFMSAIIKNEKKQISEILSEIVLALKPIIIGKKYNISGYVSETMRRLRNSGYVEIKTNGKKQYFRSTPKGEQYFAKLSLLSFKIKDRVWDGKWRLVVFDIKEDSRHCRDLLRRELSGRGFVKIQNSVWVYPYECEEYVGLLKTSFELGKEVLYIIADKIENDSWIKREYGLG